MSVKGQSEPSLMLIVSLILLLMLFAIVGVYLTTIKGRILP